MKPTLILAVMSTALISISSHNAASAQPNEANISTVQNNAFSGEKAMVFTAQSGETVDAYEGELRVPENRNANNSRMITLKYIRFPAIVDKIENIASPRSPIIYLAGGPGGSGINAAKYDRFPLFMAMREFGDVIAFDQRGTGASNDMPNCRSSQNLSTTEPTSDDQYFALQRIAFAECLDFWKDENIDVRGYNTLESVADLDALRVHFNADKISLWGISYGSHLALAALAQIDDRLDKVIIAATEGLDQTIKQPVRGDAYIDRLQAAIDIQAGGKSEKFPDIKSMIARVLNGLETQPLMLQIPMQDGSTAPFLLQKRDMQQYTAGLFADPDRAAMMLNIYKSLDEGNSAPITALLQGAIDPNDSAISFRTMGMLMDVASGSGATRRAMIEDQAKSALLGLHMNATMHLETVDAVLDLGLDLGDDFRKLPVSKVPTLILSSTLDGRTYPESHDEASAGLSQRQLVNVRFGGHNVFMSSPEVTQTIQAFMRGTNVNGNEIIINLPEF